MAELFAPLPAHLSATDGELIVRLATPDDADDLFELLALPELRNPAGYPESPEAVRAWVSEELGPGALVPNRGRDLIWVIQRDGVIVGSVVSALYMDDTSGSPVRSAFYYDMVRHPSLRGARITRRTVMLIEPLLVDHCGVEQVSTEVYKRRREQGGLVAAAELGFGAPSEELPDRYRFRRAAGHPSETGDT